MTITAIVRVSLGILAAFGLFAQSGAVPLTFEVASIKPSSPDARGTSLTFQPPNGLQVTNAPLRMVITFAYDIRDFQLSGGPAWIGTERYDILAKADRLPGSENVPADPRKMTDQQRTAMQQQMRERVRALLAERFQLVIHRETKDAPVYALVVAKGGSKLQAVQEAADGPVGLRMGRGQLTGMAAPMPMLANVLSSQLGRPVVDKTGLREKYNFKMEWTPDSSQGGEKPGLLPPGVEPPPVSSDPDGPSIFTAIQEQLGLRLESQKGPVATIVIDRVEKPSAN
jgi:uncharacterized protein (TIGR03435 family)